jgi:hypothetical protein
MIMEKKISDLQYINKKILYANKWKLFKEKRARIVGNYIERRRGAIRV